MPVTKTKIQRPRALKVRIDSLAASKALLMNVEVKEFKLLHEFFVCSYEFDVKPTEAARQRMVAAFGKAKNLYEQ